jgi:hypothetical protein
MKTMKKFYAWWLRFVYRKRLIGLKTDPEPSLFYCVVLSIRGMGEPDNYKEYLYVGNNKLLPTSNLKKRNNFLMISL